MKTSQKPQSPPQVEKCIEYIESCGWKLEHRARNYYYFYNTKAYLGQRDKVFTLKELRDAYSKGW